MIPTHSTSMIVWTINVVSHSLCLAVHHLSEIRSSVSLYLVRSRSRQALFLVPVVWHPLWPSHMLARLHGCDLTEWAQSVPLRHLEGQIPLLIHALQPTLSECLKATFMITQLRCDVWCPQSTPPVLVICMISWSKDWVTSFHQLQQFELSDSIYCYACFGCVHHIIHPMIWPRYWLTSNVHDQETIIII